MDASQPGPRSPMAGTGRGWSDVFVSDDVDRSRDHVASLLSPHALEHRKVERPPVFRHRYARCGTLALHDLAYTMHGGEAHIRVPELPGVFLFELNLHGMAELRRGSEAIAFGGGQLCVINAHQSHVKRWCTDGRQMIVKIPKAKVEQALSEMIDGPVAAPVRFDPVPRPVDPSTAGLRDVVELIRSDLDRGGRGAAGTGAGRHTERLLIELLLQTIPSNYTHRIGAPASPRPSHVKRAMDFIHAHACDELTLDCIVVASGTSARSLQDGFRRHLDSSPMGYLRAVRLDRARQALAAGDAGVTEVALSSGFNHLSKFAKAYRERFGERPSETLNRRR